MLSYVKWQYRFGTEQFVRCVT